MISIHKTLKLFGGKTFFLKRRFFKTSENIVRLTDVLFNNGIRLYSSEETAVQVLTFKSLRLRKKSRYTALSWILLLVPASAFGLGTWQVFRKFQKDAMLEMLWEKVSQPAVDLPQNLAELETMQYRRIRVKGKFDHSKEIYLGPRPKLDKMSFTTPSSLLSRNVGGYMVVTPFKLSDRNLTILVNRGWVPNEKLQPSKRLEGQITEEVELIGLVRREEKRSPFGKKNYPGKFFNYRDIKSMAQNIGAAPVFLDADEASSVPGGPLGGQTIMEFRNIHISYIFTWYGLASLSGYMWYLRHFVRPSIRV